MIELIKSNPAFAALLFSLAFVFMLHVVTGYRLYRRPFKIVKGKLVTYPFTLTHVTVLNQIRDQQNLIKELQRQVENYQTQRYKTNSRQTSFLPVVNERLNGQKPSLRWSFGEEEYILTFKNPQWKRYFVSEDYVWVDRYYKRVGKLPPRYDGQMWVRWPVNGETGDNFYNADTDIIILQNFPYMPNNNKQLIPEKYLPFTWELVEEPRPQFSVKQYELAFKDK